MSRKFQNKKLDLVNLDVISADKVWDWSKKRNGKPTLRSDLDFFGRVDKGSSAFISSTNKSGQNYKFVEDSVLLPKTIKNKIINLFHNGNRKIAYLVKKKSTKTKRK
ncbi:MAG: hypothetical protein IJZ29_02070 [Clostridia bacterium]|nr:hypothetical protein [Clostridia bacterium]